MIPFEYFSIIPNTPDGMYFPIKAETSGRLILFFTKVKILSRISNMAIKKIKEENLLKNITTKINKIINTTKSIYT